MAKKKPHKYTRSLQFDRKTKEKIYFRDHGCCIFCEMGYETEKATYLDLEVKDVMHFIPKSQLGLGIEKNGAIGCRYHHGILDNGNRGMRQEMLERFEAYLRSIYADWSKEELVYKKYDF